MSDPKTAWLKSSLTGNVLVMGNQIEGVKTSKEPYDLVVLNDVLQEAEDPVGMLKSLESPKVAVVVPNEYLWPPNLKPFTNPNHKQNYDADLLAQHLEEAGFTHVLGQIEFSGWVFLTAEGVRA